MSLLPYQLARAQAHYADVLRATRAFRAFVIRRKEFEVAKDGSSSMLTWLGRNELGQSGQSVKPAIHLPIEE